MLVQAEAHAMAAAASDKVNGAEAPAPQGQVTMGTSFGKALNALAKRPEVKRFLEIGTWYGAGSTLCIAQGLRDSSADAGGAQAPADPYGTPPKLLYTLELFEPAWDHARRTLRGLPVRCLLGGTVPESGYLKPEEMSAEDLENGHYKLYYQRDVALARTSPPLLEPLCRLYEWDAVLIDGNEYTGWAEYEVIRAHCPPRYLALHDTGTLKTRKVQAHLAEPGAGYRLMAEGMDGAGWAIYEKADA
jgi:hypothetical protein